MQDLRYKGGIQPGRQVLLNEAAEGIGTLALQYAKAFISYEVGHEPPVKYAPMVKDWFSKRLKTG